MKKLIIILGILIPFLVNGQVTAPIRLAAKLNVSNVTGSDPYNLTVSLLDDLSRFTLADISVGDSVYLIDGSDLLIYVVTNRVSNVITVDDPLNTGIQPPTGQGAIISPTVERKYPTYISSLRDDLRSMIMNRFSQLVSKDIQLQDEITEYIGISDVAPAVSASSHTGETWRNSVGELYYSDGTSWLTDKETKLSATPLSGSAGRYKLGIDTVGVDTLYVSNNGTWRMLTISSGGGSVSVPLNQVPYGTGAGITSSDSLTYNGDTLKVVNGTLELKSPSSDKYNIVINNRKPFTFVSGPQDAGAVVMYITPPVENNPATQDTPPPATIWNVYTKYHANQLGNHVIGIGNNLGLGNSTIDVTKPGVGISMENFFQPLLGTGSDAITEWITHWKPLSGPIVRPFAWYGNNMQNILDVSIRSSVFTLLNHATNTIVFNNTGNEFLFYGSSNTGSAARPDIRLYDRRNITKFAQITTDTSTLSIAGQDKIALDLNNASGWIEIRKRLADTKLLFGRTTPNVLGQPFFLTQNDVQGFYPSGGHIVLGGYSTLGAPVNNGWGGVGSNYYINSQTGNITRLSGDVSNGIYFENNTWKFWNAPIGAAGSAMSMTTRAMINSSGQMALVSSTPPTVSLDIGGTDAVKLAGGTTAQRPTVSRGLIRVNSTTSQFEGSRDGTTWENFAMGSGITTIGAFSNTGSATGLTLSGNTLNLNAATALTPGAWNLADQELPVGNSLSTQKRVINTAAGLTTTFHHTNYDGTEGSGIQEKYTVGEGVIGEKKRWIATGGIGNQSIETLKDPSGSLVNVETHTIGTNYSSTEFLNKMRYNITNVTATTYQVTGKDAFINIPTTATTNTVTLPEIVSGVPAANQVRIGDVIRIKVRNTNVVTFNRSGADEIATDGVSGTTTSFSTTSNVTFFKELIATDLNEWTIR